MNWNKEIIKGPFPAWVIILCAVFGGGFFCLIPILTFDKYSLADIAIFFALGVTGYIYLWFLATIAKKQNSWLRRNIRLIATIGGLINAALILWSILNKK
jgi:hypothetical protein